jgi:hypothetical protein
LQQDPSGRTHPGFYRPKRHQLSIPSSLDDSRNQLSRKREACPPPTTVTPPPLSNRPSSPARWLTHVVPAPRPSLKRSRSGDAICPGDYREGGGAIQDDNAYSGRGHHKRLRLSPSPVSGASASNACPPPPAAATRSLTPGLPRISLSLFNKMKSIRNNYLPSLSRTQISSDAFTTPSSPQVDVCEIPSRLPPPRGGSPASMETSDSSSSPLSLLSPSLFPSLPDKVAPNGEATRVEVPFDRFYNQVFRHKEHAPLINDVAEKIMTTRRWAQALRTYGKTLRVKRRSVHSGDRKNYFLELLNHIVRLAPTCGFNVEFENDIEYQRHTFDGKPNSILMQGTSIVRVLINLQCHGSYCK